MNNVNTLRNNISDDSISDDDKRSPWDNEEKDEGDLKFSNENEFVNSDHLRNINNNNKDNTVNFSITEIKREIKDNDIIAPFKTGRNSNFSSSNISLLSLSPQSSSPHSLPILKTSENTSIFSLFLNWIKKFKKNVSTGKQKNLLDSSCNKSESSLNASNFLDDLDIIIKEYKEFRMGHYHDDNDDLGIYYTESDLRLADEEGTYLVPVRIFLDKNGNIIDNNPQPRGTLSSKSYNKRSKREDIYPTMTKVPKYNKKLNNVPIVGNDENNNSLKERTRNRNGSDGNHRGNVLGSQPMHNRRNLSTENNINSLKINSDIDGNNNNDVPNVASVRIEWRGGKHGRGTVHHDQSDKKNKPPSISQSFVANNDKNNNNNNKDVESANDNAKRRRKLFRTVATAWFTHSGEPRDILAFKSLIACNTKMYKPPPVNGPFSAEVFTMILLFIPTTYRHYIVNISSVCKFWRYHANFAPHWTRFRLNSWIGNFPSCVAAQLKQQKIVTRDELFEERRRALEKSKKLEKNLSLKKFIDEFLVLLIIYIFLFFSWGCSIGFSFVSTLDNDLKLGSVTTCVFIFISILEYFFLKNFIERKYFYNKNLVAGAGEYARPDAVNERFWNENPQEAPKDLTRRKPASTFFSYSRVIRTSLPLLFMFNICIACIISLLMARVICMYKIIDKGTITFNIWNSSTVYRNNLTTSEFSLFSDTPKPSAYVSLPAPLDDPRWMLFNSTMMFFDSSKPIQDKLYSSGPFQFWSKNRTDFLTIPCLLSTGNKVEECADFDKNMGFVVLWFDAAKKSPLFNNSIPFKNLIPDWWVDTFESCIVNKTLCKNNINITDTFKITASLLLRTVNANTVGFNPFFNEITVKNNTIKNETLGNGYKINISLCQTDIDSGTYLGSDLGGFFAAVPSDYITKVLARQVGVDPYEYINIMRNTLIKPPEKATYPSIYSANYFSTETTSGQEHFWFFSKTWNGDKFLDDDKLVITIDDNVNGSNFIKTNITEIFIQSPWFSKICYTNGTIAQYLPVPFVRWDLVNQDENFGHCRISRLQFKQYLSVIVFILFLSVNFLFSMACPMESIEIIRMIVLIFVLIFINPITLLLFGILCMVQSLPSFVDSNFFHPPYGEEPFMCNMTSGIVMAAIGGTFIIVISVAYCVKQRA